MYRKMLLRILFFTVISVIFASQAKCELVISGNRIMDQPMEENLCALTFDDGPSINTEHLLKVLEENNIYATFFVLGTQVTQHPSIMEHILAKGHEIGNHSWSHPNLRMLSEERQREEIEQTDNLLRALGVTPLYMRPPYGAYDETTIKIANELGISLVLWSLDSKDWRHLPGDYSKLISTRGTIYENGNLRGIFLFHDTHKATVGDAQRIIDNLKAGGCDKFVTVSEYLLASPAPERQLAMKRSDFFPSLEPETMLPANHGNLPLARCGKPVRITVHDITREHSKILQQKEPLQISEAPPDQKVAHN